MIFSKHPNQKITEFDCSSIFLLLIFVVVAVVVVVVLLLDFHS